MLSNTEVWFGNQITPFSILSTFLTQLIYSWTITGIRHSCFGITMLTHVFYLGIVDYLTLFCVAHILIEETAHTKPNKK